MNLRSIDLNLLTVFDAIMAEQNLSRASRKIGMSQPAISNALARLRVMMKDDLFISTGRGVRPTPQAMELAEPIREILDKIADTLSQTQRFDYTVSTRKFTLSSADYGVAVILPPLLDKLNALNARISIDIQLQSKENLKDSLHFGAVDFALEYEAIQGIDLKHKALLLEGAFCITSKNHPSITEKLTLNQYCQAMHISTQLDKDQVSTFDKHLIQRDIQRNVVMRVPNYFNMPYVVSRTELIGTLPSRLAIQFSKQFDLNLFPAPIPDWQASILLISHYSKHHDPGHKWLSDIIIDVCRDL